MKKILFLFVVLSTLIGCTSCGSDDVVDGISSKNPLVGTWEEEPSSISSYEIKFNKDMTGSSMSREIEHYWDSGKQRVSEVNSKFTYEYNKEKTAFRRTTIEYTFFRYENGRLTTQERIKDKENMTVEYSFEIKNDYDREYILVLTINTGKDRGDKIVLYKK